MLIKILKGIKHKSRKILRDFQKSLKKSRNDLKKSLILCQLSPLDKLYPNLHKFYPVPPETVATPEAKFMNFVKEFKYLKNETYTFPDIYTASLNQVIYCPNPRCDVILSKSRRIIEESVFYKLPYILKFINLRQLYQIELDNIPGTCSIIRGWYWENFYHVFIESIPRLYLLNQPEYQHLEEIKLLFASEPTKVEKFYLSKLAPKNIKITIVENPNKLYLVERLIFPTKMTRPGSGCLPSVYLKYLLDRVAPNRERNKIERIFISRAKATIGRRIKNEDELFDALKKYGFKKYFLEELPLESQIELFYDADYVVASHGAGLSNIIFSEKIKILELFNSPQVYPYFYYLAKSLGHTYGYYYGHPEDPYFSNSDFTVNVPEFVESFIHLESKQSLLAETYERLGY